VKHNKSEYIIINVYKVYYKSRILSRFSDNSGINFFIKGKLHYTDLIVKLFNIKNKQTILMN